MTMEIFAAPRPSLDEEKASSLMLDGLKPFKSDRLKKTYSDERVEAMKTKQNLKNIALVCLSCNFSSLFSVEVEIRSVRTARFCRMRPYSQNYILKVYAQHCMLKIPMCG